jgi:hypothetical protein
LVQVVGVVIGKKVQEDVHLLKRVEVQVEVVTILPMEVLVATAEEAVVEAKLYNGVLGIILHLLGVQVQQVVEGQYD